MNNDGGGVLTNMSKEEYFFYEWLILDKRMTQETFSKLTPEEHKTLIKEYANFKHGLIVIEAKEGKI